jgi:hypothetical protein
MAGTPPARTRPAGVRRPAPFDVAGGRLLAQVARPATRLATDRPIDAEVASGSRHQLGEADRPWRAARRSSAFLPDQRREQGGLILADAAACRPPRHVLRDKRAIRCGDRRRGGSGAVPGSSELSGAGRTTCRSRRQNPGGQRRCHPKRYPSLRGSRRREETGSNRQRCRAQARRKRLAKCVYQSPQPISNNSFRPPRFEIFCRLRRSGEIVNICLR